MTAISPTVPAPSDALSTPDNRLALRRTLALAAVFVILDTLIAALTREKTLFLYKERLHLSAGGVTTIGLLLGLPSFAQPFFGGLSNIFPLWGFHRRSYYVLAVLLGALGFWGLAHLPVFHYATVLCLMFMTASAAVVLWFQVNTVLVVVGNRTGSFPRLQALTMFLPGVLSIAGTSHLSGYVTEHWSYPSAYLTAAGLTLLFLPLVFLLEDRRTYRPQKTQATPEQHKLLVDARQMERKQTIAALRDALRSPGMWAIVGYVFYLNVTPYVNTACTYYETDVLHFSKQFIGDLGAYGSAGSLIGIAAFGCLSRRLPARFMTWSAMVLFAALYLFYMGLRDPLSARISVFFIGFSIPVGYLCTYALAGRMCPPRVEGTIYSLVIASISSSYLLSEKFGSWLYDYFGPHNPYHHYSIAHGWYTTLWIGFGFTLLAVGFLPFLPSWAKSSKPLAAPENAL